MYSSSEKPLPLPAPFWTYTVCPSDISTAAPEGVMPTRYSLSLISVGTPIRIDDLLSIARERGAHYRRASGGPSRRAGEGTGRVSVRRGAARLAGGGWPECRRLPVRATWRRR